MDEWRSWKMDEWRSWKMDELRSYCNHGKQVYNIKAKVQVQWRKFPLTLCCKQYLHSSFRYSTTIHILTYGPSDEGTNNEVGSLRKGSNVVFSSKFVSIMARVVIKAPLDKTN